MHASVSSAVVADGVALGSGCLDMRLPKSKRHVMVLHREAREMVAWTHIHRGYPGHQSDCISTQRCMHVLVSSAVVADGVALAASATGKWLPQHEVAQVTRKLVCCRDAKSPALSLVAWVVGKPGYV
eukprot:1161790-Pelagomonas_calceolata.AAC.3